MPRIACLGWGSLIWRPGNLPIASDWFADGPEVPVEFLRQSADGRITLVLHPDAVSVPALWAYMGTDTVKEAMAALCEREGAASRHIAAWSVGDPPPELIPGLPAWCEEHRFDAVIWTALPPRFQGQEHIATAEQVIEYLRCLEGGKRDATEEYIRRAPVQISTRYRRQIEAALGWTPR